MGLKKRRIAILCDYRLLPERVGGMDYFFWAFQKKCYHNKIEIDWFFPNEAAHGDYSNFHIIKADPNSIEETFLLYCKSHSPTYSHIICHFIEICTPFFKSVKGVLDVQIIAVDHNPRPLNGYSLKKALQKKLKGLLFSRYIDAFIGVSQYTVEELIKDFGAQIREKTIKIYNGVIINDILFNLNRAHENPKFLVASHLRESKGIQDLIEAVALLSESIRKDLRIDIYGDGPFKPELVKRIKYKELESVFQFMGSKPNLNTIYREYDYMIQPTHMECFSLSILESLAANVPVITTNVGGNEEAVKSGLNGFIYKVKDINMLANIIEEVFLGVKRIEGSTRNNIENHFSIEKMVENHFKLLQ